MRILITGATGQLGRSLVELSEGQGVEVLARSHPELDISNREAVIHEIQHDRPTVIINAAAYTSVDRAESDATRAHQVNSNAPGYLAEAASTIDARLIHLSTDFVFDGASGRPYRTDDSPNPINVYGSTKLQGEKAVMGRLQDLAVVIRTSWVYSPYGRNFLDTMLRSMRATGLVRVVADQVSTPTSALSLSRVLWRIAHNGELHGLYHWTDAGVASWYDFAVAIAEESKSLGLLDREVTVAPICTDQYPTPARRPHYSVLDCMPLRSLGLQASHWRQELRRVLREMRRG